MDSYVIAAGLVFRGGKILITRRKSGSHLGDYWEFPGGKRFGKEALSDCLVREIREEVGINVRVGPEIFSTVHRYPERRVDLHFFQCEWESGEPSPIGCEECLWVEKKRLLSYSFPPANAKLIEKLQALETLA